MGASAAKEEKPAAKQAPTLDEASATLQRRIEELDRKIERSDEEAKRLIANQGNPTAKARAMQALKRKQMYQQQRDQLVATDANVEQLAFQQEQAQVTMVAVEAMQNATAQLKLQKEKLSVDQVDKLTDDMAELQAEMQEMQEALARPAGTLDAEAESELEAEYAKLQEEQAMAILMGGGSSSITAPAQPAAVPAAAAPATATPAAAPAQAARQPASVPVAR